MGPFPPGIVAAPYFSFCASYFPLPLYLRRKDQLLVMLFSCIDDGAYTKAHTICNAEKQSNANYTPRKLRNIKTNRGYITLFRLTLLPIYIKDTAYNFGAKVVYPSPKGKVCRQKKILA